MADNPPKYLPWLPRVSQIVEYAFPFVWFARDRFHEWLRNNQIEVVDYMKEASEGWTYVHTAMETYGATGKWRWKKYSKIVKSGIQFHKDTWIRTIDSELYIRTPTYQGTIDRVAEYNGEKWILDWKTFGLAKHKFWLPIPVYKKPYDKLKKARLQLSLYAHAIGVKYIAVVELDEDWYHFHPLELMSKGECDKIVAEYNFSYIDQL